MHHSGNDWSQSNFRLNLLSLSNYKTFDNESISFKEFNVIIGANGSGKSNLISSIRFLKNVMKTDGNMALRLLGNFDHIALNQNNKIKIGASFSNETNEWEPIIFRLKPFGGAWERRKEEEGLHYLQWHRIAVYDPATLTYSFQVDHTTNQLVNEVLQFSNFSFALTGEDIGGKSIILDGELSEDNPKIIDMKDGDDIRGFLNKILGDYDEGLLEEIIWLKNNIDGIRIKFSTRSLDLSLKCLCSKNQKKMDSIIKNLHRRKIGLDFGIATYPSDLEEDYPFRPTRRFGNSFFSRAIYQVGEDVGFENIKIFDFEPKKMKEMQPYDPNTSLNEDGGNLFSVLERIFNDLGEKGPYLRKLQVLLPHIEDIRIEEPFPTKRIMYVKEIYNEKEILSYNLSDGTICLMALVATLFYDDNRVLIFEEPERNFHPKLVPQIMSFVESASAKKQILITTHNPEFIKWTSLENILLVHRGNNGFSHVDDVLSIPNVQYLLSKDIGIGNIFINDNFGV